MDYDIPQGLELEKTFGVVDQIDFDDSTVVSIAGGAALTPLPESEFPEWNPSAPAGTYKVGDTVMRAALHRTYKRVGDHTAVEATPPEDADPKAWKAYLPTNRWSAFDMYMYTQTVAKDRLRYVLRPGRPVDTIWLGGLSASHATITVTEGDGGPVLGTLDSSLDEEGRYDWKSFFLSPTIISDSLLMRLETRAFDPVITIDLTNPGAEVRLGSLVAGVAMMFGTTEYDTDIGRVSYSYFKEAEDGTVELRKRPGAGDINVKVAIDPIDVSMADYLIAKYDAQPTLWLAHTSNNSWLRPLRKYGLFDGRLTYNNYGQCSLSGRIKGMV